MVLNNILKVMGLLTLSVLIVAGLVVIIYMPFGTHSSGAQLTDTTDFVTMILTAVTVILAALAIILAILGFIGYTQMKSIAERAARETAEKVAKERAEKIAETVARDVATSVASTTTVLGQTSSGRGNVILGSSSVTSNLK